MYPIIKNVIYWQASTITEGLSSPLSFMMFILPEAKFTWREKKGCTGKKETFGFLPSVTSSNSAPPGLSVTQLPWQREQTGSRGTDQTRFGAVYSNIYCHPENERNTGVRRQQDWASWVMSVLTKTQGNADTAREASCLIILHDSAIKHVWFFYILTLLACRTRSVLHVWSQWAWTSVMWQLLMWSGHHQESYSHCFVR